MPKLKMKIVSISLVIFFGSIIPLSYVHELGHGYVCMMEGYDFDVQLSLDGGRMVCHGEIENQILFRASGGVLAGIAALIPLTFFRTDRRYPMIAIGLLPLALGHFLNAVIETIFYETYMQDSVIWGMIMGLFAFVIFVGLATKFGKKEVSLV